MQFTKENAEKVMAKAKTQTRRLIKEDEQLVTGIFSGQTAVTVNRRAFGLQGIFAKWVVGRTYAVCPGRGKLAIGHVKLLEIQRQKLQDINLYDCAAELGETMSGDGLSDSFLYYAFADLWDNINPKGKRWADNPEVWALTFEVVP